MMSVKIEMLKKIANELNENNIVWNLGASCMLFLRGIITDFADIDLMVSLNDVNKVQQIMSKYIRKPKREKITQYKTKFFLEYDAFGVDIDIMAGFTIVNENATYYFPLESNNKSEKIYLDGVLIYLATVEEWYNFYKLMKRSDKVDVIENYFVSQGKQI